MAKKLPKGTHDITGLVKELVRHRLGEIPHKLNLKPTGLTNSVFEVNISSGNYIIRTSTLPGKISDYLKEQWAIALVKSKGIPVAEVLEVGNDIIEQPYMIQEKLEGEEAAHSDSTLNILHELGEYAAIIHKIQTNNFGNVFDWSDNKLSKNATWKDFLKNEFKIYERIELLESNKIMSPATVKKIKSHVKRIEKWNDTPVLNHGDLRLKNVIVNNKAKISAIIDWENCSSNIAPYWDLSIALHDLTIDEKQSLLEGYGMKAEDYRHISFALKAINILNYTTEIEKMIKYRQKEELEQYRSRLNGHYDLFCL